MEPTGDFWGGVGTAVGASPGWMVVGALLVVSVAYIVARYIVPSHEKVRMRRLDIEQQRAQTDAERVRANAMLAEQQRQTNVLIDGMRQSLDASTAHTDVLVAELRGARERSRAMGGDVSDIKDVSYHIRDTTDSTHEIVMDIKQHLVGGEGTD